MDRLIQLSLAEQLVLEDTDQKTGFPLSFRLQTLLLTLVKIGLVLHRHRQLLPETSAPG
jgi:hypothetical protein